MSRKSDPNPPAEEPEEDHPLRAEVQGMMTIIGDEDPVITSRKAKAVADTLKALTIKREFDAMVAAAALPVDLAAEEKLREQLLRRLDAFAAQVAEAEGLEYPDALRPRFDRP